MIQQKHQLLIQHDSTEAPDVLSLDTYRIHVWYIYLHLP